MQPTSFILHTILYHSLLPLHLCRAINSAGAAILNGSYHRQKDMHFLVFSLSGEAGERSGGRGYSSVAALLFYRKARSCFATATANGETYAATLLVPL